MELVKEFVKEIGDIPQRAEIMTAEECINLTNMVMSEMIELLQTVMSGEEAKEVIRSSVDVDYNNSEIPETEEQIIGDQADACVDTVYYILDRCLRKGINFDRFFDIVHQANMRKRWDDGTFHKNLTNKVIKPEGWIGPNTTKEAKLQIIDNGLNIF